MGYNLTKLFRDITWVQLLFRYECVYVMNA